MAEQAAVWGTFGIFGSASPAAGERKAEAAECAASTALPAAGSPAAPGELRTHVSTRGPVRAMSANPPEDADRNLDFDALVQKYEKKIFNVIYRFLGDYEEAVDLTQETFISAFRRRLPTRARSKRS